MTDEEVDQLRRDNLFLRGACIKPDAVDDYLRVCRELNRLGVALRAIADLCNARLKNGYREASLEEIVRIAERAVEVLPKFTTTTCTR